MILLLVGCTFLGAFTTGGAVGSDLGETASDDTSGDTAGADTGDSTVVTPDACDDAPIVTYETFGAGFLLEACQACHARSAADRQGAPTGVAFDTEADVSLWAARILARAGGESADMPPAGGTTADERYLLSVWLTCHPPEP